MLCSAVLCCAVTSLTRLSLCAECCPVLAELCCAVCRCCCCFGDGGLFSPRLTLLSFSPFPFPPFPSFAPFLSLSLLPSQLAFSLGPFSLCHFPVNGIQLVDLQWPFSWPASLHPNVQPLVRFIVQTSLRRPPASPVPPKPASAVPALPRPLPHSTNNTTYHSVRGSRVAGA